MNDLISIVVPIFNEQENLANFVNEVKKYLKNIKYEIIFCCDPSSDNSENIIADLVKENPETVKSIIFSRRFGQNVSVYSGLEHSNGNAIIIMDVDGQDPVSLLPEMINKWINGSKIVIGRRVSRKGENYIKKLISKFGLNLINKFSDVSIQNNIGEFRLIDREIVNKVLEFKEANPFLRGIFELVGYEREYVDFNRLERKLGTTKYNRFTGSILIGFNGLTSLSNRLLYLSAYLGIFSSFLSLILGVVYFYFKINGILNFPIGNPTIVILVLFIGGVQLLSIGIIGVYVGQIFDNVKNRPLYIISKKLGNF